MIIPAREEHLTELVQMGLDLWPDQDYKSLQATFSAILSTDKFQVLLFRCNAELIAFLYLGVRTDYVEGSESSPTGYVEGIYVKPAFRRRGISRQLPGG